MAKQGNKKDAVSLCGQQQLKGKKKKKVRSGWGREVGDNRNSSGANRANLKDSKEWTPNERFCKNPGRRHGDK